MDKNLFSNLAVKYAMQSYPIIVTDSLFVPIYYNPAATADAIFVMRGDCIAGLREQGLDAAIDACDESGHTVFFATLGKEHRERFKIEVQREQDSFVFSFFPALNETQLIFKECQRRLMVGYDYMLGHSLHELFAASELMLYGNAPDCKKIGLSIRKNALQSIRIAQQAQIMKDNPVCSVVNFRYLIQRLFDEISEYVQKHFSRRIAIDILKNNIAVKCDPRHIRYILLNLVSNALRFSKGDVLIQLSVAGDIVLLTVRDNGKGMKNAEIDFGKTFSDGEFSTGAGLGLATSRQLAFKMQGTLLVQSCPGGAQITVALPLAHTETFLHESATDELLEENMSALDIEFSILKEK